MEAYLLGSISSLKGVVAQFKYSAQRDGVDHQTSVYRAFYSLEAGL